jgi:protein-S-isoprenylcysteine O-methyltransferase Ste14
MPQDELTHLKPVLPPTYFFLFLLAGVLLHLILPLIHLIPWPYRLFGCLPLVFGGWITIWADQVFKQRGTTIKPHLTPSALVTQGPFGISRHPMSLGMTLCLAGIAVLLGSLIAFVAPIAFAVVMQLKFIPMEEGSMERVFGDDYTAYKQKVRCWI